MTAIHGLRIRDGSVRADELECVRTRQDGRVPQEVRVHIAFASGERVVGGEISFLAQVKIHARGINVNWIRAGACPVVVRCVAAGARQDGLPGAGRRAIAGDHPLVIVLARIFRVQGDVGRESVVRVEAVVVRDVLLQAIEKVLLGGGCCPGKKIQRCRAVDAAPQVVVVLQRAAKCRKREFVGRTVLHKVVTTIEKARGFVEAAVATLVAREGCVGGVRAEDVSAGGGI